MSNTVTKTALIEELASKSGLSKSAAGEALNILLDIIGTNIKNGNTVAITGFGTFGSRKTPARNGRNPRTGAEIKIAASKTPTFKAGATLKALVK